MTRLVTTLVIVLLTAGVVHAQDGASPDELLAEGVELRRRGRDAEALERFERAHAIAPMFSTRQDPGVVLGLVLDGIAQAAGATVAIIGLLTRERSPLTTALGPRDDAPRLALSPWAPEEGGAGLTVALTHL